MEWNSWLPANLALWAELEGPRTGAEDVRIVDMICCRLARLSLYKKGFMRSGKLEVDLLRVVSRMMTM